MQPIAKGTEVEWNWGAHKAVGKVAQSFVHPVTRTIKGETIKRNASADEPAYLVRQEDGARALKSHSELTPCGDRKS